MRNPFSIITTSIGRAFAWHPIRLELFEIDEANLQAAQLLLNENFNFYDAVADLKAAKVENAELALRSLMESGLMEKVEESSIASHTDEPMGFRIVLTEKCNLRCAGCFSTTALLKAGVRLKTMTESTMRSVVEDTIAPYLKRRELAIHFFGGEPILQFSLIRQAVDQIGKLIEGGGFKPSYSVTSNGTIFSDDHLAFFKEHNFDIGVSIELNESIHGAIRPFANGISSFSAATSGFDKLKLFGCNCHILITPYPPLPSNLQQLFTDMLDRFPSRSITINTPFEENSLAWLGSQEHLEFLVAAHRIANDRGIEVDSAMTPILAAISNQTRRLSPQATLGSEVMLGITTDGHVVRSTQKFDMKFLVDDSNSHVKSTFSEECDECPAQFVCGGPNEEFQQITGRTLDMEKCNFHVSALKSICENVEVFENLL